MRTLTIILVVLILTQLSSCSFLNGCGSTQDNLTNETKKWNAYGDRFKWAIENSPLIDTVRVSYYVDQNETIFIGDECPEGKMESITAKLTSNLFQDSIFFRLEQKHAVRLECQDAKLWFSEKTKSILFNGRFGVYHKTFTLNQQTYSDVLTLSCSDCGDVEEIDIGKTTGLIAIKIKGDYWMVK